MRMFQVWKWVLPFLCRLIFLPPSGEMIFLIKSQNLCFCFVFFSFLLFGWTYFQLKFELRNVYMMRSYRLTSFVVKNIMVISLHNTLFFAIKRRKMWFLILFCFHDTMKFINISYLGFMSEDKHLTICISCHLHIITLSKILPNSPNFLACCLCFFILKSILD